ncbi:hypothetical protein Pla163_36640 [Planctomycetes bacterium Pla163]|uniref:DUF1579 domain-containing protein n=1 Tax=Rohdeia mirabilis TaxID=2528008 RepID=A0A518D4W7_9BACT|nr:hypothetical protein Pla163_36640 [Planctomycetes bacterium Pla163]
MKPLRVLVATLALALPSIAVAVERSVPATQDAPTAEQVAEMMAAAARYTQPGPEHRFLELLVGDWDVGSRFTMMGSDAPVERGTATTQWKVPGRWLESHWSGSVMGTEGNVFHVFGYDRLKMSFVWTGFSDMDTALNRAEGDLTQNADALILYGTLDEYLTGEHDKMVKYVYRFGGTRDEAGDWKSIDRIVLEVHDLAIGEANTKVLEFTYVRK